MPSNPDRNRRRVLQNRERYDTPRAASLQDQPTPAMRQRAFAAALLSLPVERVSDDLLVQVEGIKLGLLVLLAEARGRSDGRPPLDYIKPYFGIDEPVQTTAQLSTAFGVAHSTVQNGIDRGMTVMRAHLQQLAPQLLTEASQIRAAVSQEDHAFWDKVDKRGDCWRWTGATDLGYGVLKRKGKKLQAHRYAYELANGPATAGMHIVHTCRNRACVNPDHLQEVEPGEVH